MQVVCPNDEIFRGSITRKKDGEDFQVECGNPYIRKSCLLLTHPARTDSQYHKVRVILSVLLHGKPFPYESWTTLLLNPTLLKDESLLLLSHSSSLHKTISSASTSLKMVEMKPTGGRAKTSSRLTTDNMYSASRGFRDGETPWSSRPFSRRSPPPAMLWYQFPSEARLIPAKITFKPRQDGDEKEKNTTPTKFEFVGANATRGTCEAKYDWTNICNATYGDRVSLDEVRGCGINASRAIEAGFGFQCLGLRIWEVNGEGLAAALQGVRIWIWKG